MAGNGRAGEDGSAYTEPRARRMMVSVAPRTLWLAAGVAALFLFTVVLLTQAVHVLILLFIAIILAEGIKPLVNRMRAIGVPRPLAVGAIYLALLAVAAVLGWLLLQPVIAQVTAFVNALPSYIAQAQRWLAQVQRQVSKNPQLAQGLQLLQTQIGGFVQQLVSFVIYLPLAVGNLIFNVLVVLVMAFFWLTGVDDLKPFAVGLLPASARDEALDVLDEMGRRLGGYLRGVVVNMAVIGVLSGLGLWALGVPYPALLGLLAGLTEIIPFFGPWISGTVAALVAGLAVDPLKAGEVVLFYMVIQQLEGNTLVPLVMNRAVQLNPMVVVVGVLLGGALLGLAGSVLAVPLAVVIEVLVTRVLTPAIRHASSRSSAPTQEEDRQAGGEPRPAPEPPVPATN
jgi:predicted PurR-regulated permease PerM